MARTEARIKTSIWTQDGMFLSLPASAQRLYLLLCSQSTVNLCGVIALTPGRWARMASDTTIAMIEADLEVLESTGFVIVDRETQEVFIRTLMKHDHVLEIPKVRGAARDQLATVISVAIYNLIAEILDVPVKEQANTLYSKNEIGYGIPTCVRARADSRLQTPDTIHQTPLNKHVEISQKSETAKDPEIPLARKKRASLVPDEFPITDKMRQWASENHITLNLEEATEEWLDFWRSEGSLKADWLATWRNGMKSRQARAANRVTVKPASNESQALFLLNKIRQEGA